MRETAVKQLSATPLNSTSQSQWLSTTRLNRIGQGQTLRQRRLVKKLRILKVYAKSMPSIASGTFLQTLADSVTPLKVHSLSPRSCMSTDVVSALRKVWVLI